jgi:hypothetical protein
VASRASYAIARPGRYYIKPAAAGVSHHLIEARPLGLRSRYFVREFRYHFAAALGGHLAQIEDLRLGVLIVSRNPRVDRGAFHARLLFRCLEAADSYLAT